MNKLMKLAVSSLVLGTALVGGSPAGMARQAAPSAQAVKAEKLAAMADAALKAHDAVKAIELAEGAVLFNPQSAGHRALLGQAYLLAGRFASAETAFRDALQLDPANRRPALSLALVEIAQGKTDAARGTLDQARGAVSDADLGLALALAGDKPLAIAVLEGAARADGATPKARQNLALAYALAGRWQEAQIVAAQDVPADQLLDRMTKWAQFARVQAPIEQVASLLNVKPVADAGLPERLALIQAAPAAPEPVAVAGAPETMVPAPEPVAVPAPEPASVQEPAAVANAAPAAPVTMPEMAAAETRAAESVFFAAPAAKPAPVLRPVALPASQPTPITRTAAVRPKAAKPQPRSTAPGKFVVQLGAFSNARGAEIAWSRVARSARLGGYTPSRSTFVRPAQATVYRLSVGGFATRAEAAALCRQVSASGGQCFVRGTAGDAPIQFVFREKGVKLASR